MACEVAGRVEIGGSDVRVAGQLVVEDEGRFYFSIIKREDFAVEGLGCVALA